KAKDVLLDGGSAVDAAIAALICTALVNPQSMGLGGGAIFTIMDKSGKVKVISSRETVPKSFKSDLLQHCPSETKLIIGPQWIGVPGELRGYARAHELYGKLPWARLLEPSIKLAREGFPLPEYLGRFLQHPMINPVVLKSSLCELFCHPDKTSVLKTGDTLRYPILANTLETLAKDGPGAFYTGQIAQDLVHDVQATGGSLTLEDLSSFEVRVDDAQRVSLGEYHMYIPPLPAGGALISFILNIMHGRCTFCWFQGGLLMHRPVCYGQAPVFSLPVGHFLSQVEHLTDPSFADEVRAKISDSSTHPASFYNITPSTDRFGTTHVSVLAADGSAVSVTSTINHMFGSAVYSSKTGIILNNELADFCNRVNSVSAGEQPPSSMAPTILQSKDRERVLVIGGSGGSMITTAMAMSIMNRLWLGMSLEEAISAKVVFVDSQNKVNFEPSFDQSLLKKLESLGHTIGQRGYFLNVVNAVEKEGGCISAVSDKRKNGVAAGY
uniref:Gamma-glutamyltransferase 5 n=1 Tax=Astyanax mexicanus TaxID=7994 RepID=A0A8B9LE46_ASTMX